MSKHAEIVLAGSKSSIKQHVIKILNEWSKLSPLDKESYREQFPDSALILDSKFKFNDLINFR